MDEGFRERLATITENLPEPLRDPKKVALLAVIIVILFWGLFLRPRPGTLSVKVVELDSGEALIGAQVELVAPDGRVEQTEYSDNAGRAFFNGVAAGVDYGVDVTPDVLHKRASESITLESGEEASIEARVERDYDLNVELEKKTVAVGAGCSARVPVTVENAGEEAVELDLVADGAITDWVSFDKTTLGEKEGRETFFTVRVPAGTKNGAKGKVRAKYTRSGSTLDVGVSGEPGISASPKSISESLSKDNSFIETLEFSLKKGADIEVEVECSVVGSDLQGLARVTPIDDLPLTEGNTKVFRVDLGSFSPGRYLGKIVCSTSCGEYSVLVDVEKN